MTTTKTGTTCVECGAALHPNDADVAIVGFGPDGAMYLHPGACRQTYTDRSVNTKTCRGCRRGFDRRRRPGQDFCTDQCGRDHTHRLAQLWVQATQEHIPEGLDAIRTRRNAVAGLVEEVRAGRFDDVAPRGAGVALERYDAKLAGAEHAAVDAARREAEQVYAEQVTEYWKTRQSQAQAELSEFASRMAAE
jgi:hypothetical protein